jgi:hypothetical protein
MYDGADLQVAFAFVPAGALAMGATWSFMRLHERFVGGDDQPEAPADVAASTAGTSRFGQPQLAAALVRVARIPTKIPDSDYQRVWFAGPRSSEVRMLAHRAPFELMMRGIATMLVVQETREESADDFPDVFAPTVTYTTKALPPHFLEMGTIERFARFVPSWAISTERYAHFLSVSKPDMNDALAVLRLHDVALSAKAHPDQTR